MIQSHVQRPHLSYLMEKLHHILYIGFYVNFLTLSGVCTIHIIGIKYFIIEKVIFLSGIYNFMIQTLFLITVPFTTTFSFNPSNNIEVPMYSAAAGTADTNIEIPQEGKYDLMLDSAAGPLTYYNQNDSRWGDYLWGGKDPLSIYGCGPTIMAMLITSLTGNQVFPADIANWAAANRCWAPGDGSYHSIIRDSASAFGIQATPIREYTAERIKQELNSGHLVVALMKKGHFTQSGHFLIITRMTDEGKMRIADPNNYNNTTIDWDPAIILHELNHHSSSGGPLWAISLPQSY